MENSIKNAIEKSLNENGIILLNVKFGFEEGVKTLFVTIDSEKGVDTDLCIKATNIINPIIDSLNLDLKEYVLDVGSKGE